MCKCVEAGVLRSERVADVSVCVCVRAWLRVCAAGIQSDGSGAGGRAGWEISSPHHIEKSQ